MSNPGPPGEDQRPLAGPDASMGMPESGTQHATSTDFALPLDPPAGADPLAAGGSTAPRVQPTPPAYDDPTELVSEPASATPAYDALVQETGLVEPSEPTTTVPPTDVAGPTGGVGAFAGPLAAVKAFADKSPEAFLALALAAGWLVGRLFRSSDDED